MPDLLIRNLPSDLKEDIARRAKHSGKSLSEEAKQLLANALKDNKGKLPMGQALRKIFAEAGFADLELPNRIDKPQDPFAK